MHYRLTHRMLHWHTTAPQLVLDATICCSSVSGHYATAKIYGMRNNSNCHQKIVTPGAPGAAISEKMKSDDAMTHHCSWSTGVFSMLCVPLCATHFHVKRGSKFKPRFGDKSMPHGDS